METNKREQTPQEDTLTHTHIREKQRRKREKESEKYKRKIQEEEKERRSNDDDDDDDGNGSSRRGKRGGERRATKDNCYPAKRELLRRFGTMVSPRARTKL